MIIVASLCTVLLVPGSELIELDATTGLTGILIFYDYDPGSLPGR